MTEKRDYQIVIMKPKSPYYGTKTEFEKSLGQIREMITRRGVEKIMDMRDNIKVAADPTKPPVDAPLITLIFTYQGKAFIIKFPIVFTETRPVGSNQFTPPVLKLRMDISARIIHDRVKAYLIEMELGTLDFTQCMCPFLALTGPDGTSASFQEVVQKYPEILTRMGAVTAGMLPGGA